MMRFGVANSIAKDKNYDPVDTLDFAIKQHIKCVQLYIDQAWEQKPLLLDLITTRACQNGIVLLCHAPEPLNESVCEKEILSVASRLLTYQKEKYLVVHFDEQQPIDTALTCINRLNRSGFTVCVENYYQSYCPDKLIDTINQYNLLLENAYYDHHALLPVIDIPRFFITQIRDQINPLFLTKMIFNHLALYSYTPIVHVIDVSHWDQNRDSWCAVGKGLIPYRHIFRFLKENAIVAEFYIFEFENTEQVVQSIQYINRSCC